MAIKVTEPGLLTTIQDLGRKGFQQYGVVVGGVMDDAAARLANIMVGNSEDEAVLELTVIGPSLMFEQDYLISICGADLSAKIDNIRVPLWRPVLVKKGSCLTFGRPINGCRSYVAVAGGFDVPVVMNSRSTYIRGKIGGIHGRALIEGDRLNQRKQESLFARAIIGSLRREEHSTPFQSVNWTIPTHKRTTNHKNPTLRIIKGPQFSMFSSLSQEEFLTEAYKVTPQSDRMGYRLSGSKLDVTSQLNLLSEAVPMGTIQVPNDGQPIVLMSDHQTIGGYPKIGYVISVDLPLMSQVMPGELVRFKEVSVLEAQHLLLQRENEIKQLKIGIALAIRRSNK
ncbi:5-oxoprolinase subunit C family protein [Metabacillus halosaccharovorans]|uniref:Biotin-dependent carboxyltransferase family protein n=1 Tax=Metabacillus halosaccharovorans TaxID=930124 RepID=A0ABT3DBB6_9BACI|nr:biotin-dependent carboxyltransferase family protein [Metabacillus halosaccharovorans]MCV9884343.1 biotin-dependent carboxyltransferase family protein [Metabacillus halosaccharovorans]